MEDHKFTNREFIVTLLEADDITKALRVWERYLNNHSNRYAPIWVKEMLYEEWLELPFDQKAWDDAGTKRAFPGSIPKNYVKQVKKFVAPLDEERKKLREEARRMKANSRKNQEHELCDEPIKRADYEFKGASIAYFRGGVHIEDKK
jgi:hypothetical protein